MVALFSHVKSVKPFDNLQKIIPKQYMCFTGMKEAY